MAQPVYLDSDDLKVLLGVLRQVKERYRNAVNRVFQEEELGQAPTANIAWVGSQIPALTGGYDLTGTGTGPIDGVDDRPGYSDSCVLYRIDDLQSDDPVLVELAVPSARVYNLSVTVVPANTWVLVHQVREGAWVVVQTCCGDTGTGGSEAGTSTPFSQTIGNGVDTEFTVTHGFGTKDVLVGIRDGNDEFVDATISTPTIDTVLVTFDPTIIPGTDEYTVVVQRGGGPSTIPGYTTTVTSNGTTTLTSSSTQNQYFTGSSDQTVILPAVSTLTLGQIYNIENRSTGTLTVQSSGGNTITSVPPDTTSTLTVVSTAGTGASSWDYQSTGTVAIPSESSAVSSVALRDGDGNLSANSFIAGYATTVTTGGTTTLSVDSAQRQYFTGTSTQTVLMPVVSTLTLGQSYSIANLSTGDVTVQSSGGNVIAVLGEGEVAELVCVSTSGTGTASWDDYTLPSDPVVNEWQNYTGTTTDAYATVLDLTNNSGLHGSCAVKNTGGVNSLTIKWTATDMYGNVGTNTPTIIAGATSSFSMESNFITSVFPPYVEIKLEIKSASAGNATTYDIWRSFVG